MKLFVDCEREDSMFCCTACLVEEVPMNVNDHLPRHFSWVIPAVLGQCIDFLLDNIFTRPINVILIILLFKEAAPGLKMCTSSKSLLILGSHF